VTAITYVTPARVFFPLLFVVQFFDSFYASRRLETPWLFDILSRVALIWLIWWWLRDDSRRLGITWVLDLGMFLVIAWIFILPYHLFKTRGLKAFIPILAFILVTVSGAAAAVIVSFLL
jgi:hypothetical protein